MSSKNMLKDVVKVAGFLGALVISGGLVSVIAYRLGRSDVYIQIKDPEEEEDSR